MLGGVEKAAVGVLSRAVEHDNASRYTSALVCYQEGIQLLIDAMKETSDTAKRGVLRDRVTTYMDRAEKIKALVKKEKAAGTYHEQVHIESGSVGHSYERTFGHLLDDGVTSVEVDDAYVRSVHQAGPKLRSTLRADKEEVPFLSADQANHRTGPA